MPVEPAAQITLEGQYSGSVARYRDKFHHRPVGKKNPTENYGLGAYFGVHHDECHYQVADCNPLKNPGPAHSGQVEIQQAVVNKPEHHQGDEPLEDMLVDQLAVIAALKPPADRKRHAGADNEKKERKDQVPESKAVP